MALSLVVATLWPASAASFAVKRGLNLDQWVTWPTEDQWDDENALLPFPEWMRFVDDARLRALKTDGFDFVRMPVDPAPFLSSRAEPLRERLYASVLQAVQRLREADLKVVVDLHLIERADNPDNGMAGVLGDKAISENYLAIVQRLATLLANQDPHFVALELMNEPGTVCDEAGNRDWLARLERLHETARKAAPELTLVLTGGCAGNAEGLTVIDPSRFDDANTIWTFHSYQPFLLTHQGAQWAGDFIRYVTGLSYPLDASTPQIRDEIRKRIEAEAPLHRRAGMLAYLDEQLALIDTPEKLRAVIDQPLDEVAKWAMDHEIAPERILLGEFGMIRQEYENPFVMPAASRAHYVKDVITAAEAHGFAWAIWGYGGAFGIVESFSGEPAEPDVLDVVRALSH